MQLSFTANGYFAFTNRQFSPIKTANPSLSPPNRSTPPLIVGNLFRPSERRQPGEIQEFILHYNDPEAFPEPQGEQEPDEDERRHEDAWDRGRRYAADSCLSTQRASLILCDAETLSGDAVEVIRVDGPVDHARGDCL